jgi:hypothetical protein
MYQVPVVWTLDQGEFGESRGLTTHDKGVQNILAYNTK